MIGTRIIPIPWDLRIPILGGIRPIKVPITNTPNPMNPVLNQTNALTNTITEITMVLRGINSCNFSIFWNFGHLGVAGACQILKLVTNRCKVRIQHV